MLEKRETSFVIRHSSSVIRHPSFVAFTHYVSRFTNQVHAGHLRVEQLAWSGPPGKITTASYI